MTIAIAEDNTTTRRELSRLLTSHGYETVLPDDFKDLAGQLAGLSADLILLDVNLPYENGYDICRRIRELTRTPVIFVTSRDTSADELMSIRAGGIDFVSKPYDPLILLEKIRRALRLTDPGNFRELTRKGCTLDLHLSVIRYSGREAELTRNEFRILYYFFMNSGKVIGKEELLEKLWNDRFYLDENVLMVNMTRLKHKLREIGITHLLENIRGKGGSCEFYYLFGNEIMRFSLSYRVYRTRSPASLRRRISAGLSFLVLSHLCLRLAFLSASPLLQAAETSGTDHGSYRQPA